MRQEDEVLKRVKAILSRSTQSSGAIDAEFDIVDSGAIDSAGFMELFCHLEEEFDIVVTPADLDLEKFRTARRIAALVVSKRDRP